jgi:decaprenylphospho-beta-D-erythro-pentofuranosid-2-ulose 2-reductase
MQRVVVLGATSAIAEAVARRYAAQGAGLFLVARSRDRLEAVAADLRARGAGSVDTAVADLSEVADHAGVLDRAWASLGGIDVALIAYGVLPDQALCERSWPTAETALRVNFTSPCALLHELALRLEPAGAGVICVIASVAGDRGRMSNYIYGAAKGGLALYAQGLRHRLAARGIRVVVIKPGFVDTPMTAQVRKGPLFASPARVARDIQRGIRRGSAVVYTPWWWRIIMAVIRAVPDRIFERTRL